MQRRTIERAVAARGDEIAVWYAEKQSAKTTGPSSSWRARRALVEAQPTHDPTVTVTLAQATTPLIPTLQSRGVSQTSFLQRAANGENIRVV
jgi:hypothetical protein